MKKKRSIVLPILGVIVALALVGFFASRAGLDKALVKQKVDGFITQMQDKAREKGRDVSITYRDLEVVGSFAGKHVVMHDPVMTVKPLQGQTQKAADALRITTEKLEIYPETSDLSTLRILAPDPVDFAGGEAPDKSLLNISSNVPPSLTVQRSTVGDVAMNVMNYISPSQMKFTYLRETQATGDEEKTPTLVPVYESLSLAVAQGSGFSASMAADGSGIGKASLDVRDLVITPEKSPQQTIKAPAIKGEWSNALNEKKLNVVRAVLNAGPITSDDATMPYQPVTLALDATYEGAMPKSPEAIASIQSPESTFALKALTLSTKDASLNATGNFTASAADMLPVGTANIALSNVPYVLGELRNFGLLNSKNEPLVGALLQRMTGTPVEQLKDVAIPIERIRGGAFKVGNTTFEELFALLLSQAMQIKSGQAPATVIPPVPGASAQPPLVPQLPPSDKPKSTPIEVPDPSVRG